MLFTNEFGSRGIYPIPAADSRESRMISWDFFVIIMIESDDFA